MDDLKIARINQVMADRGYTMYRLSSESGISRGNLARQLKGKQTITNKTLSKIAHTLNVSFDWLEKGIGDMMCPDTREFLQEENEREKGKDYNNEDKEKDESALRELVKEMKQQNEVLVQQLNASQEQIKMLLDILSKK